MKVSAGRGFPYENGVKVVSRCVLRVSDRPWLFAQTHAPEIAAHWMQAQAANPAYFNGVVHLIDDLQLVENELHASLVRTEFKSFLYWRAQGFPEAGVVDGFGSALIRSSDGQFLLVSQRPGNVNSGFAYLPSGFIDERDVDAEGGIDIARSVTREIEEEIGEAGKDFRREEGIIVTRSDAQLCLAVPFQAPMTAEAFAARVAEHNAQSADPELEAIIPVGRIEDLSDLKLLPYARALLEALLAGH